MTIDSRIAMGLQVPDMVGSFMQGANFGQQQSQQGKLRDLLPQAAQGDQQALNDLWAVDPNIAMKMDARQREQAAAMTEDLSGAVRWADTPEKWQYVQQHYGQKGMDLSPYKFEDREKGLIALDKISGYLKGNQSPDQPSSVREYEYAKGQGFDGSYMDFKNEFGSPIVQRNEDGTMTVIPRSAIGGGQSQRGGPRPGQVEDGYRFKGGNPADPNNWIKVNGGQTPQASGGFPSSGS